MSTIQANAILDASGGNTTTINGVTPNTDSVRGRNLIINGAMNVNQRGNLTGITSASYFVDRFQYTGTDEGTWSLSQSTDVPSGSGFTKSAKLEITTADSSVIAGDYAQLRYKFENQDVKHLLKGTSDAKTITLSFWVKSSLAQEFKVRIRENYSSTTRQIIKSFTIASANTWQKVTITFGGDTGGDDFSGSTDTSSSFVLEWMMGAGTDYQGGTASNNWEDLDQTKWDTTDTFLTTVNSTFYITGVKLEVGSVATEFDHRSYGEELSLCQRYFETIDDTGDGHRLNGVAWSTTNINVPVPFLVEKRVAPTVTIGSNGQVFRAGSWRTPAGSAVTGTGLRGCTIDIQSTSYTTENGYFIRNHELTIDAEL